jgi:hypothetical protein
VKILLPLDLLHADGIHNSRTGDASWNDGIHAGGVTGTSDYVLPDREETWSRLAAARASYEHQVSAAYDEVLVEVAARVSATGSIGKADIGALVLWKRLRADTRWARRLMAMTDIEVRSCTAQAADAVRDRTLPVPAAARSGRRLLSALPGFATGDALASALLVAAAPDRMAVYDRRAHAGLELLGEPLASSSGRYGRYMHLIEKLLVMAHQHGYPWIARDVDLALYRLGGR